MIWQGEGLHGQNSVWCIVQILVKRQEMEEYSNILCSNTLTEYRWEASGEYSNAQKGENIVKKLCLRAFCAVSVCKCRLTTHKHFPVLLVYYSNENNAGTLGGSPYHSSVAFSPGLSTGPAGEGGEGVGRI